jgi:4-amino-4-deoxy-L-arabinose transferase-like glycosyltransferase
MLLIGEAHIAKTDAVLVACVTAAQLLVAHFFIAARQGSPQPTVRNSALLGLALGIGILVKGPMILFFVGLTVVALSIWERRWGWVSTAAHVRACIIILINVPGSSPSGS